MTFVFISYQSVDSFNLLRSISPYHFFEAYDPISDFIRIYESMDIYGRDGRSKFIPTLHIRVDNICTLVELIKISKDIGRFELQ